MNIKMIISRTIGSRYGLSSIFSVRSYAADSKSVALEYDEVPVYDKREEVEEINRIRNKSRLRPAHQNMFHNKRPYEESMEWFHDTVRYKRKMLGRYGLKALDVPAGIAWPTEEDLEDAKEYERVAYPHTLEESWKIIEEKRHAREEEIRIRQLEIEQKLQNMEKWGTEMRKRIQHKANIAQAAKDKKDAMILEIQQHYGLNLNPNSPQFKALMRKKIEEDELKKKAMKKEKRAAKSAEFLNQQILMAEEGAKAHEEQKKQENKQTDEPKEAQN